MLEHVYEYERVSACAYLCEMTHGYENTEVGVHYCDWLLKYYAPAHAQMRKKERKVGGFSEGGRQNLIKKQAEIVRCIMERSGT